MITNLDNKPMSDYIDLGVVNNQSIKNPKGAL